MGQISISRKHPWSNGLNDIQISPYLQELQAYAGQDDNYESAATILEKYLRIDVNSSQIKRVTKFYSEVLTSSDYSTENRLQEVQQAKIIEMKQNLEEDELVYGMVDGGMLQTREGEKRTIGKR